MPRVHPDFSRLRSTPFSKDGYISGAWRNRNPAATWSGEHRTACLIQYVGPVARHSSSGTADRLATQDWVIRQAVVTDGEVEVGQKCGRVNGNRLRQIGPEAHVVLDMHDAD